MNTKNILNLIRLQISFRIRMIDLILPFFGVAFILALGFIIKDNFEGVINASLYISLIMSAVSSTQTTVQLYFNKYDGLDKTMLPASNMEKFVSMLCVIMIVLLMWSVALAVGLVALCIIGPLFYEMSSSYVLSLCLENLSPDILLITILFSSALMLWLITGYVENKLKYITRVVMFMTVLPVLAFDYIPASLQNLIGYTYFVIMFLVYLVLNYHCFKKTQQK